MQVDGVDVPGFGNVSAAGALGDLGVVTVNVAAGAHTGVRLGSTGPFLQSVLDGTRVAVRTAGGGGTSLNLEARRLIATGANAHLGFLS